MMLTLAFVVLCSSIVVFFSQEFTHLFKRILSIPGVPLLLPLVLASLVIEVYEEWGHWLLLSFQAHLHQFINLLATHLPFELGAVSITRIVFLFLFASLPVWFFQLRARHLKRRHPQTFTFWLGLALWIIGAILLTVVV